MSITASRTLVLCAALLLASGCASRTPVASDGGGDGPVLSVSRSAAPTWVPTTPTTCPGDVTAPPAATPTTPAPTTAGTGRPAPDVAPHQAENNAWKQRRPLTPDERARGVEAADKVLPLLEALCAKGDFTTDSARKALVDAGLPADTMVELVEQRFDGQPPMIYYNATLGTRTCVLGDLTPGHVRVFVEGPTGEGSCHEPKSH
ncbi:hypothetical protein ACFFQW_21985 [Umezawaea endophytica]|uniref:Uncharacterized protein n=1 Tax=Umezawaea endophytica TaxID=1654476 RepID=A0A9X2VJ28_9PSEU|nr:hypothetical protein [Umezawaea endophytica]MCS7477417.1 hypothetical protein [Umezawaea endophytica]